MVKKIRCILLRNANLLEIFCFWVQSSTNLLSHVIFCILGNKRLITRLIMVSLTHTILQQNGSLFITHEFNLLGLHVFSWKKIVVHEKECSTVLQLFNCVYILQLQLVLIIRIHIDRYRSRYHEIDHDRYIYHTKALS